MTTQNGEKSQHTHHYPSLPSLEDYAFFSVAVRCWTDPQAIRCPGLCIIATVHSRDRLPTRQSSAAAAPEILHSTTHTSTLHSLPQSMLCRQQLALFTVDCSRA